MSVYNAAPAQVSLASDQVVAARHGTWHRAAGAFAFVLATAVLLVPAFWNGFPFLFADTGGYVLRPFEHTLELGRSALYGAFLASGIALDFWPNVLVQAALTAWVIKLTLRAHGLGVRSRPFLLVVLALVTATSLPWFAGQLMPDIFVPLAVLALYLLTFQRSQIGGFETVGLGALVAFAIANHMAILALAVVMLLGFACLRWSMPWLLPRRPQVGPASAAVGAGIVLALTSNLVITGVFGFTPGGPTFLFGSLLDYGIVARYLADRCPDPTLRLCVYQHELPTEIDNWLWPEQSPLQKLGGWDTFEPEARRIIADTLWLYPGSHLARAHENTAKQLVTVQTGDGIHPHDNAHVEWVLAKYAPHALSRYRASVQHDDEFKFAAINDAQVPIALLAFAALPLLFIVLRRRRLPASSLVLTTFIAFFANAAICGVFAIAANRYQSRLAPLAVFACVIAALELRDAARRKSTDGAGPTT